MYETTVKTPEGDKLVRTQASSPMEAKQQLEQLYGTRNVPYIPKGVAS